MLRPYRNGHHAQVLMNTAVFFTISDTKSKANANQIMYSAVRCRLPECGGFVLQRKDEGFTFIAIINDLTNHHHRHHHQNHHHDSHQVLTAAGNVGFANRSKVTQRCLHLPPWSRTRCTSAPCAPLCRCTHNPANFVLAGAWAWNQFAGDRRVEVVVVVMSHWHHHKIPPMTTWPSSSSPGQDCSTSCTQTTSCSSSLRTPGLEKLPPRVEMIGEVHSDINHYRTGDQSQPDIQTLTCYLSTWPDVAAQVSPGEGGRVHRAQHQGAFQSGARLDSHVSWNKAGFENRQNQKSHFSRNRTRP